MLEPNQKPYINTGHDIAPLTITCHTERREYNLLRFVTNVRAETFTIDIRRSYGKNIYDNIHETHTGYINIHETHKHLQ
jgi:hypothetical protein